MGRCVVTLCHIFSYAIGPSKAGTYHSDNNQCCRHRLDTTGNFLYFKLIKFLHC